MVLDIIFPLAADGDKNAAVDEVREFDKLARTADTGRSGSHNVVALQDLDNFFVTLFLLN
jgi:hypothetical protein